MLSLALATGTAYAFDHKNGKNQIIITENSPDIFIPRNEISHLEHRINRAVQELVNPTNIQKSTEHTSEITRYQDHFTRASIIGIDETIMKALVWHESLVDPKAVSPKGATGLCQFIRTTAKEKGIRVDSFKDYRYHPNCIEKAAEYLNELYDLWNEDVLLALMSYNAGPKKIEDAVNFHGIKNVKDLNGVPDETRNFMIGVLSKHFVLREKRQLGIYPEKKELFTIEESKALIHEVRPGHTIYEIAKTFGVTPEEILRINLPITERSKIKVGDKVLVPVGY